MPQHIYNKPDEYEWGLIFDNGEVFSRVDIPDRALLKNEIKKALSYKRLQAQRHRPYGKILHTRRDIEAPPGTAP